MAKVAIASIFIKKYQIVRKYPQSLFWPIRHLDGSKSKKKFFAMSIFMTRCQIDRKVRRRGEKSNFANTASGELKIKSKVPCNDHNHDPLSDRPKSTSFPKKSPLTPHFESPCPATSASLRALINECLSVIKQSPICRHNETIQGSREPK